MSLFPSSLPSICNSILHPFPFFHPPHFPNPSSTLLRHLIFSPSKSPLPLNCLLTVLTVKMTELLISSNDLLWLCDCVFKDLQLHNNKVFGSDTRSCCLNNNSLVWFMWHLSQVPLDSNDIIPTEKGVTQHFSLNLDCLFFVLFFFTIQFTSTTLDRCLSQQQQGSEVYKKICPMHQSVYGHLEGHYPA